MAEPNNGRILGGGHVEETSESKIKRRGIPIPEEDDAQDMGDQFEQEANEGKQPPATVSETPHQTSQNRQGEGERLADVQSIMSDLMSSDMANLRVTNISIELNGTQKLKISFGKERGRMLTLYVDGTWRYAP